MTTVPTLARRSPHLRCTAEFGCCWRGPAARCPFHALTEPADFAWLAAMMSARPFAPETRAEATC